MVTCDVVVTWNQGDSLQEAETGAASRSPGVPTGQANCQMLRRGQEGLSLPKRYERGWALLAPRFCSSTLENCETTYSCSWHSQQSVKSCYSCTDVEADTS